MESERNTAPSKRWKEPTQVRKQVEFVKALYAARMISRNEYVLFAVTPVESIHDERWTKGEYDDELEPISKAIREIEKEHGLTEEESWPRGQGPKEHTRLNRKYEGILDAKFLLALREFQLDDLADLKTKTPSEYDRLRERGRRSVFHKDDYRHAIKDVVIQYEEEARSASAAGAFSVAVTALGAGIEGLLLLRCLQSPSKSTRVWTSLPKRYKSGRRNDHSTWNFETLIEVCVSAGWLPAIRTPVALYDTATLAHILRRMRNYVHPGKRAKQWPWSEADEREYRDAEAVYQVLVSILGKIGRRRKSKT